MSCNPATGEEGSTGCLASLSHAGLDASAGFRPRAWVELEGAWVGQGGMVREGGSDSQRKEVRVRLGESGDGLPVRTLGTSSFLGLGNLGWGQRGRGRVVRASWQMVA